MSPRIGRPASVIKKKLSVNMLVEPVEHALLGDFAGHRLAVVASALLLSEARERRPWHERGQRSGLTGEKLLAVRVNRERDVVTLLLEGLSYAQIARELYVTRSTVAFHLSNAYAKTGTTSRHELVQLVRTA